MRSMPRLLFPFSKRRWFFWLSNFALSAAELASSSFVQHQRESYSCDLGSRPYLFRLAKHKCFPAPVSLTHRECQITLLRSTFSSSTKSITAKIFLHSRAWQSGSPIWAISLQQTKPQRSGLGKYTGHRIIVRIENEHRPTPTVQMPPCSPVHPPSTLFPPRRDSLTRRFAVDLWSNLAPWDIPDRACKRRSQTKPNPS